MLEKVKIIIPCSSLVKEDELNEHKNILIVNIKKINYTDIFGLEKIIQLKKRFCSIKNISSVITIFSFKAIYQIKMEKHNQFFQRT